MKEESMSERLRPWRRRQLALEFATRLARQCEGKWAADVRSGDGNEHSQIRDSATVLLEKFLEEKNVATEARFVIEGVGCGELSYPLLGTDTYPDAAVLGAFRCAIEFDRQPASGWSHFKGALLKAAAHSISGAYDATLFVYTLRRKDTEPGQYLEDYGEGRPPPDVAVAPTQTLLSRLTELGVVWAFVPPVE
ncbi:MAG: hypothetical protein KC492_28090 [Myxococcales bacterium]|nr:hypothetical protein [Myxococcales bacterium]